MITSINRLRKNTTYVTDNCDLAVDVIKVSYYNDTYIKFKGLLYNKKNGIPYETKNYKVYYDMISHWRIRE